MQFSSAVQEINSSKIHSTTALVPMSMQIAVFTYLNWHSDNVLRRTSLQVLVTSFKF